MIDVDFNCDRGTIIVLNASATLYFVKVNLGHGRVLQKVFVQGSVLSNQ